MVHKAMMQQCFCDLGKLVDQVNIKDKPQKIWNSNETGLQFYHNPSRVVAKKRTRNLHARTANTKENVTVMASIKSAGEATPPMY
ncbi:hypothetical protein RRG08_028758 [Elysia crispata]|uniref:Uncharacterized protein n=1 Tax=Elysia crispata TaxID=231223 RepID=A0AAE0ZMB3_9GAST|nr:hypothetical protein RRG08_028758 [Elysia crispata]